MWSGLHECLCLQRVDGATMNTVLIFGLKVIFVITLVIGPVSEIRSPAGPFGAGPRCRDFSRTDEAFPAAVNSTIGFTRAMTGYAVSAVPQPHKHTLLT
jgi:hypothetical protein